MQVSLIAVMTLCGKISPGNLGSSEDRRLLEDIRAITDASLLGAGSLRAENAEMRGPGGSLPVARIRALITASGQLPWRERKIFRLGPRPLVFTAAHRVAALVEELEERAEIIGLPADGQALDLTAACRYLSQQRGVKKLLLEGGGGLNYQALRQGIVDELLITIAPKLSGDRQAATLLTGDGPLGSPFLGLELMSCRPAENGELFCRYRVRK